MKRVTILLSAFAALLLAGGLSFRAQSQAPVPAKAPEPLHLKASAIQIEQIQADEVKLPAEFQVSLYENVVEQVSSTNRFEHVYRDGDHRAADAADLVILHSTVTGFKEGSARARQVTTVAGATLVKVHVVINDRNGKFLLETDVTGSVIFLGENLRATYDFGKKVAGVVKENFVPAAPTAK